MRTAAARVALIAAAILATAPTAPAFARPSPAVTFEEQRVEFAPGR